MIGVTVVIRIDSEDRDEAEEWLRGWMDTAEAVVDFEFLPVVPIDMDPAVHVPFRLQGDDEDDPEDEDGPPPDLNPEGDPTRNGAFG